MEAGAGVGGQGEGVLGAAATLAGEEGEEGKGAGEEGGGGMGASEGEVGAAGSAGGVVMPPSQRLRWAYQQARR